MTNSPLAAQQLINSCQGLVRTIAWKIHCKLPKQVDLEDLVGYGQVGLAESARSFDPDRGGQFTTYAYYRIRGAILDGLSTMSWFSRADYARGKYEQLANEVLSPDNEDSVNSATGDLQADARWLKGVSGALAMVYLCSSGSEDEGDQASSIEDHRTEQPGHEVMQKEMREKLNELIDNLPDDARQLIRAAYFEGLTLTEAGQRIGVSKAWASRLHAKTLGQLAQSFRSAQLAD